ncbi:MAG: hypothetical protein ACRDRH_18655 [Pseudonocardia sp.]
MSTVTTIPTLEQSSALARLMHRGELTDEHRYLIAKLLDEIGTVRPAARRGGAGGLSSRHGARGGPVGVISWPGRLLSTGKQAGPLPVNLPRRGHRDQWAATPSAGCGPDWVLGT